VHDAVTARGPHTQLRELFGGRDVTDEVKVHEYKEGQERNVQKCFLVRFSKVLEYNVQKAFSPDFLSPLLKYATFVGFAKSVAIPPLVWIFTLLFSSKSHLVRVQYNSLL
jgi:hypothetical protein